MLRFGPYLFVCVCVFFVGVCQIDDVHGIVRKLASRLQLRVTGFTKPIYIPVRTVYLPMLTQSHAYTSVHVCICWPIGRTSRSAPEHLVLPPFYQDSFCRFHSYLDFGYGFCGLHGFCDTLADHKDPSSPNTRYLSKTIITILNLATLNALYFGTLDPRGGMLNFRMAWNVVEGTPSQRRRAPCSRRVPTRTLKRAQH